MLLRRFLIRTQPKMRSFGSRWRRMDLKRRRSTFLRSNIKNPASGRTMIKNGMIQEGLRRDHVLKEGEFRDIVEYGILNPNH